VTFSIVARSNDASLLGVAIASSSAAVAARCAHARAGVGAVVTQNLTDPELGLRALDALERGRGAEAALRNVLSTTAFGDYRQLAVIGARGEPALHTGRRALGIAAAHRSVHAAAAGNLLSQSQIPAAMVAAFETNDAALGARLLAALRAARERGGESGPIHSAGILIVRDLTWPIVDLRVDWHESDPIGELAKLWDLFAPQVEDYVLRARDPARAPGFDVPAAGPRRDS
jgi:uncharacterized Ntn-hydrolase superfamily protein